MNKFCLSETIRDRLYEVEQECNLHHKVISLNTESIDTWEYRDRKGFELGNIHQLAESIRNVGQSQPIIVVRKSPEFKPRHNAEVQYVVIAGYRRWLACKLYGIPVQAIVKQMSFDEALACLISENQKEDVSDYSKGMFYTKILHHEKLSQEELSRRMKISVSSLNHYLAFAQVPEDLWKAVGDVSKVSSHTAAFIRSLLHREPEYLGLLKRFATEISKGQGAKTLQKNIERYLNIEQQTNEQQAFNVEFHNKSLLTVKKGRVHMDKQLLKHPKVAELFQGIEKAVLKFANQHLAK